MRVEVVAMFGDTIVDVRQCEPRRRPWLLVGVAIAAAAVACAIAGVALDRAAGDADALERWTDVLKRPAHAFRAHRLGDGFGVGLVAGVAVALGLAIAVIARARLGAGYRAGTARGVDLALDLAPTAVVAHRGGRFVFDPRGFDAELVLDGGVVPITAAMPIPARGRIRACCGRVTLWIAATARPASIAAWPRPDRAIVACAVGSLALVALVWCLVEAIPDDLGGFTRTSEPSMLSMSSSGWTDAAPASDAVGDPPIAGSMAIGAMPSRESASAAGPSSGMRVSRDEAIAAARSAGLLASRDALAGVTGSLSSEHLDAGFDGSAVYRGDGGASAFGGHGGWSPCMYWGCDGGVKVARYATTDFAPAHALGLERRHVAYVPIIRMCGPMCVIDGELDKAVVRRYIRRHEPEIRACYERQLLATPELAGEVVARFLIQTDGTVASATASGMDDRVSRCIADVIGGIEFPRARIGATQVTYPFTFRVSG